MFKLFYLIKGVLLEKIGQMYVVANVKHATKTYGTCFNKIKYFFVVSIQTLALLLKFIIILIFYMQFIFLAFNFYLGYSYLIGGKLRKDTISKILFPVIERFIFNLDF